MITALYADADGGIFDAPGYGGVGRVGNDARALRPADLIPLPKGAELAHLPGRRAVGLKDGRLMEAGGQAVAAILPVGDTRTHLPAFYKTSDAPILPLYGYCAVVLHRDRLYAAAMRSDDNRKWHPFQYNTAALKKLIRRVRKDLPGNRIVEQLAGCSLKWHCCTAQNLFYRRWEAGIPVSPACNAQCLGCISLQPAECCPSPQSRIAFAPTPEEIAAVGGYHLAAAPEGIISFGQGCEGEPSLAADAVAAGIRLIRAKVGAGQININTNAGYTAGIRQIVDAGLDTMRVSIISALPATYEAYYRPRYTLADVEASIAYARANGVYVSLNMLVFPGLNDRAEEIAAWRDFLRRTGVAMIQWRNLNMDPDVLWAALPKPRGEMKGVRAFWRELRAALPEIVMGSFSHYIGKDE